MVGGYVVFCQCFFYVVILYIDVVDGVGFFVVGNFVVQFMCYVYVLFDLLYGCYVVVVLVDDCVFNVVVWVQVYCYGYYVEGEYVFEQ